ncbi:PucR family transcriptional regulator [Leptolyngbya sp. NIES-2104]|uniref:PucR family transcriptional regulator n=1 Tax=Leptolyngbya sp. NIES-2104 TaxID=1552121 RepID=UPI0006EC58A2|nr:helix-turn-helix domain-containing protein [Leptolyngbya sp. NIES-2104]GAP97670.1 sugar diacid utilization regulator SdaR [Leptolyngbya sp. NIES-2104]
MIREGTALTRFKRVARGIVQRIQEVLNAQVFVVDDREMIVASTEVQAIDRCFDAPSNLRLPFQVGQQRGEVILSQLESDEISLRLAQVLVELIVNQALSIAQQPVQPELKNKFIHDLLRSPNRDESEVLREAQILGLDFTRPRAVILIDAAHYLLSCPTKPFEMLDAQTQRSIQVIIGSIVKFFHLPNDTICAYIGGSEIAVLKASSTQDLEAWADRKDPAGNPSWANLAALKRASTALLNQLRSQTQTDLSVGIGRYHPGIQGLARSYQDARAALSLGHHFSGDNQVYCLDDLGVAAFVGISDESTKIDLAKHLLSPLDQEPELIDTLQVFFAENCYPSSTASRLSIHRNTLSYRLDKITSLTGLNPRLFDDAIQIRLALLLRSLVNSHPGNDSKLGDCTISERSIPVHLVQMPNVFSR